MYKRGASGDSGGGLGAVRRYINALHISAPAAAALTRRRKSLSVLVRTRPTPHVHVHALLRVLVRAIKLRLKTCVERVMMMGSHRGAENRRAAPRGPAALTLLLPHRGTATASSEFLQTRLGHSVARLHISRSLLDTSKPKSHNQET